MASPVLKPPSRVTLIAFAFLDPIPYGCFVAALIFDVIYAQTAEVLWAKGASWLIPMGLVFAIVPRLINLQHVWFSRVRSPGAVTAFWLNLFAIVAAIVNAFVHSRDAYGVMPGGLWLSVLTVALMVLAKGSLAWPRSNLEVPA